MELFIGIDDTDSKKGLCTTYLGAVLKDRLNGLGEIQEIRLVRLNPNIPWKTRGNGAVALRIETPDHERVKKITLETVEEYSSLEEEGTNPGVAFLQGAVDPELTAFYYRALREIVTIEEAEDLSKRHSCETHKFNNGRGLIGALAAIGANLSTPTYELIAYRMPENWGKMRTVDPNSVYEMDKATSPQTFNNLDYETSRILITPRSPCPVLFGIRGMDTRILETAMKIIRPNEAIERYAVFKTNQCTDAHLVEKNIAQVRPFTSVIVRGAVAEAPKILNGGHIVFSISENASEIDCAAYEPTGGFREIVKRLDIGDVIRAYGGVKMTKKLTVNLEKLEVVKLQKTFEEKNPCCPQCKRRMKSSGKLQGFRCKNCGTKALEKERTEVKRDLKKGLYCVPPRAMRHLSKPLTEK